MATVTAAAGDVGGTAEITVANPDHAALVALYEATDGPNWVNNDNLRGRGSPAIQTRFSRFRGPIQQSPVQRQETQIVQSQLDLYDFPP